MHKEISPNIIAPEKKQQHPIINTLLELRQQARNNFTKLPYREWLTQETHTPLYDIHFGNFVVTIPADPDAYIPVNPSNPETNIQSISARVYQQPHEIGFLAQIGLSESHRIFATVLKKEVTDTGLLVATGIYQEYLSSNHSIPPDTLPLSTQGYFQTMLSRALRSFPILNQGPR